MTLDDKQLIAELRGWAKDKFGTAFQLMVLAADRLEQLTGKLPTHRYIPKADATNNERLNALMRKLYPQPAPIKYGVKVIIKP